MACGGLRLLLLLFLPECLCERGTSPDGEDSVGEMLPPSTTIAPSLLLIEEAEDNGEAGFKGEGTAGTYDVLLLDSRFSTTEALLWREDPELLCRLTGCEDCMSAGIPSGPRLDEVVPS